jgi:hypothetical protein
MKTRLPTKRITLTLPVDDLRKIGDIVGSDYFATPSSCISKLINDAHRLLDATDVAVVSPVITPTQQTAPIGDTSSLTPVRPVRPAVTPEDAAAVLARWTKRKTSQADQADPADPV